MKTSPQNCQTNSILSSEDFVRLSDTDTFLLIPTSILTWLGKHDLTQTSRNIMVVMVGTARKQKRLDIYLSRSLLSNICNCSERTVSNSIKELKKQGLITQHETTAQGTRYSLNISAECWSFVKARKKTVAHGNSQEDKPITTSPTPSIDTCSEKPSRSSDNVTAAVSGQTVPQGNSSPSQPAERHQLEMVWRKLQAILKVDSKAQVHMAIMKARANKTHLPDEVLALYDKATSLELSAEPEREEDLVAPPSPTPAPSRDGGHDRQPYSKEKTDYNPIKLKAHIRKGIVTRMSRLKDKVPEWRQIAYQIIWAIENRKLGRPGQTVHHTINAAISLVNQNRWRTPSGYTPADSARAIFA